jgi:hypothetical protein
VREDSIEREKRLEAQREVARRQQQAAKKRQKEAAQEATWRTAGWSQADISSVRAGKLRVGMTMEMVRAAWGQPLTINATTAASGTEEQWVYDLGQYVYFDVHGKVGTIQTSR